MKTDSGPRVLVVDDEPSIVDAVATSLRYEGFTVDEAMTGRKALAQAQEDPPDLAHPRCDAARPRRPRGDPAPAVRRRARARPLPHRPRHAAGQAGRPHRRRRRLRHQAVRPGRGHRPRARHPAAHRLRARGRRRPALRRRRARRERARGAARRQHDQPHRHRVQPAALLHAQPAPRALQGADPRPRLALRLRRRRQRRRDLRELPAQEAREVRASADPHHPPRRLHPARARVEPPGGIGNGKPECRCGFGSSSRSG